MTVVNILQVQSDIKLVLPADTAASATAKLSRKNALLIDPRQSLARFGISAESVSVVHVEPSPDN